MKGFFGKRHEVGIGVYHNIELLAYLCNMLVSTESPLRYIGCFGTGCGLVVGGCFCCDCWCFLESWLFELDPMKVDVGRIVSFVFIC